jgi:CBS domain-containing protein
LAITLTVKSIAKPNIISLDKTKSVKEGAELMVKNNIGSLIITESGKYVGIVTERDILRKVVATTSFPPTTKLGDVMSSPLITIDAEAGLGEASSLMVENRIRRLLVKEDGKVIGIFTQRDLQDKMLEVFRSLRESQSLM